MRARLGSAEMQGGVTERRGHLPPSPASVPRQVPQSESFDALTPSTRLTQGEPKPQGSLQPPGWGARKETACPCHVA